MVQTPALLFICFSELVKLVKKLTWCKESRHRIVVPCAQREATMKNIGLKDIILGYLNSRDTYYPLESTVHISHIAQHAVAGERHAFLVSSLQLEVSSYLPVISSGPRPEGEGSLEILSCRTSRRNSGNKGNSSSFRAQRSGVEKSFYAETSRREKKSHTDYTDFHRIISPPTNHARKRADCTEPDEKKTKTTAIQSAGWLALASTKVEEKICDNQRNLREMIS